MYFLLLFYNIHTGQIYDYIPVIDDSRDTLLFHCHQFIRKFHPSLMFIPSNTKRTIELLNSFDISYYFYNLEDIKNIIRGMVN